MLPVSGPPRSPRPLSKPCHPCLPRRARCGSAGPPSSPAASGWAWSWMSRKARTTVASGACATSSARPSKVSRCLGKGDGGGDTAKAKGVPDSASSSPGLFASVSKVSKAVDAPPSSVTSTPRTPRMDFSRVTGKGRREHKGQRRGVRWVGRVSLGDTVGVAWSLWFCFSSTPAVENKLPPPTSPLHCLGFASDSPLAQNSL